LRAAPPDGVGPRRAPPSDARRCRLRRGRDRVHRSSGGRLRAGPKAARDARRIDPAVRCGGPLSFAGFGEAPPLAPRSLAGSCPRPPASGATWDQCDNRRPPRHGCLLCAVEEREHPELRGRPLVVGADPKACVPGSSVAPSFSASPTPSRPGIRKTGRTKRLVDGMLLAGVLSVIGFLAVVIAMSLSSGRWRLAPPTRPANGAPHDPGCHWRS
jgi:hypothetical protein